MDPADLSLKLTRALASVVPARYRVYERDGMVMIDGGNHTSAAEVADIIDQDSDVVENVTSAAYGALSMVQDVIAEETASSWPNSSGALPQPMVRVEPDVIHLWFEEEDGTKVLELAPIQW